MSRFLPPWRLALIGALGLLASSFPTLAADFCVSTAAELQTALTTAAFNGTDDRIRLVQGRYDGNFMYSSTNSNDLEILGGYVSGCGSRAQDPTNTVLDGGGTSAVLILIAQNLAAKFSIDGVTLQNGARTAGDGHGGGLRVETAALVSLSHSAITNNTANRDGGGLYILSGQATLDSNSFTGNTAYNGAGGYVRANRVDLLDNRFSNNIANYHHGGGIYVLRPSTTASTALTLDANEFLSNRSSRYGGGVSISGFTAANLKNNVFTDNMAGGAYLTSIGTASLTGNSFTNNQVTGWEDGGGAYISTQSATLTQNNFTGNISSDEGGGLYLRASTSSSSSLNLNENIFSGNTATSHAGGAYVYSLGNVQLTRNEFTNNTTQKSGGGAYVYSSRSDITLTENAFSSNLALEHGGAAIIYHQYSNNNFISLVNNRVFDNEAGRHGGGLSIDVRASSRISLVSNALFSNFAGTASLDALGGGIFLYARQGTLQFTNNTLAKNNAPDGGGVALRLEGQGTSVGGTLRNNLFWFNQASLGRDLWIENDVDGDFVFYPLTLLHNNFDQTPGRGINITIPTYIGPTNQNAVDPLFVDLANDDLRLSNNSPMINAGDPDTRGLPATDAGGHPRLVGQVVDIGAYENPTGDPNLADLNVGLEGDGTGRVTSEPAGIDCGAQCNAVFAIGTEVTLTATTAATNMVFTGWSGACSGTEPICTLMLNEATVVFATFAQGYPITTRVTPSGTAGTISCDPNPVPSGQDSRCTARPAAGYGFSAWSGDCSRIQNHHCTLTNVTGSRSVTAAFTATTDLTATQAVTTSYVPGGLLTITGQFNDTSGAVARGLTWLPELPEGWTVASASGDGAPQVSDNEILFTGTLTLPINFSYQIRVPEDARGDQQIAATLSYLSADMSNAVTLTATPDPLLIEQMPISRHSADYQDPAWKIDTNEASRVLAYWRAQAHHVDTSTPDGYAQGSGNTDGPLHSADYQPPQWRIDTFEVNRVLGYWRAPSYYVEPQGVDGYAPGGQQAGTTSATLAEATAPRAIQSAGADYYTPGETLTITNTIGQSGDAPLLNLVWVPALPNGWTLTGVSGSGTPELSPGGTEILFTASNQLSLPLTFSYRIQVPSTAAGNQQIRAEFTYQRLGMINPATAPATPNPLILGDTDTGGDCRTEVVTLIAPVISGSQTRRSEISIQVAGSVTVASGAGLELTAPRIAFEPGFQVDAGGWLRASSASVSCTTAAALRTTGSSPTAIAQPSLPVAPTAPVLITHPEALPAWLTERLTQLGIDPEGMSTALLDAEERWLILATSQALHPADGNALSDVYRLDLLSDRLELISLTPAGAAGNGESRDPAADALGERVVFTSAASDLTPGDDNGLSDLFLRDLALGHTERLTHTEQTSAHPALDAHGSALVYDQTTEAGPRQILGQALTDGAAADIVLLSDLAVDASRPALSADGRYLAYLSQAGGDCTLVLHDVEHPRHHRQPCPGTAAEADAGRVTFSPEGDTLLWHHSDHAQPLILANPLAEPRP